MSSERTLDQKQDAPEKEAQARLRAVWMIDRWRKRGFDSIMCYPSGYCCPSNSQVMTAPLPEGYCLHPIDSEQAVDSIVASILKGMPYRF